MLQGWEDEVDAGPTGSLELGYQPPVGHAPVGSVSFPCGYQGCDCAVETGPTGEAALVAGELAGQPVGPGLALLGSKGAAAAVALTALAKVLALPQASAEVAHSVALR